MLNEYARYDATGLAELVARKEVTAAELLEAALARAEALNPRVNAINIPMTEIARARAFTTPDGPFGGVPFLIKDIYQDYAGVPTTAGCRALRDRIPERHAEVVARFLAAGLVIFGKTATPEFALKGITESRLFGATRNPWDLSLTPGGSSGGAAAAVAAGIVPMAGASDGGGSIRIPASFCGLFGLRPSRGRVPAGPHKDEIWEGASSEHVLTRSVRDSARMLDAIAGADAGAPFVIAPPARPYAEEIRRDPGKLRIGFSMRSPLGTAVDGECVAAVENAARLLSGLGHHVEPAEPAIDGQALARCYFMLYFGHVAADVAEVKHLTQCSENEFELDTRVFALLGRSIPSGDYVALHRQWNAFARALGDFHSRYDLYMTPTVAQPPARIGELDHSPLQGAGTRLMLALRPGKLLWKSGIVEKLALESLQRTPFTQLSNLTGTPSMSVPLHWSTDGLPVGVQFVARFGEEATLFRLAAQLEQARPWAQRQPTVGT
jgi:amidase